MVQQGEHLPLAYMEPNRLSIIHPFISADASPDKPSFLKKNPSLLDVCPLKKSRLRRVRKKAEIKACESRGMRRTDGTPQ